MSEVVVVVVGVADTTCARPRSTRRHLRPCPCRVLPGAASTGKSKMARSRPARATVSRESEPPPEEERAVLAALPLSSAPRRSPAVIAALPLSLSYHANCVHNGHCHVALGRGSIVSTLSVTSNDIAAENRKLSIWNGQNDVILQVRAHTVYCWHSETTEEQISAAAGERSIPSSGRTGRGRQVLHRYLGRGPHT